MNAEPIVLALPKGRLQKSVVELFGKAGYDLSATQSGSRRLTYDCGAIKVLLVRGGDVPTYVDHGAADVGVAGTDVLEEAGRDLYHPLDLGIGRCRLILAAPKNESLGDGKLPLRVATSNPTSTARFFQARGAQTEIIRLGGAVELAPLTGLADGIVDLVESGETLRQNGLVELAEVMRVSARLVVNPARMKMRLAPIRALIERLEAAL